MRTVLIAQQKGGVGKTAAAAHIAWYGQEHTCRVLVIDLDTGNLSSTLNAYQADTPSSALFGEQSVELPSPLTAQGLVVLPANRMLANLTALPLEQAISNFRMNLERLGQGFDLCVIDTPPSMGVGLAAALHAADAVITPLEVENYSIQGIQDMMIAMLNARKRNPSLQFLGLVPSRVDRRNPRQVRHLQELRDQQARLLSPIVIGLRSSVADALATGMPVWKIRKTAARSAGIEMRALAAYVLQKLGVDQCV